MLAAVDSRASHSDSILPLTLLVMTAQDIDISALDSTLYVYEVRNYLQRSVHPYHYHCFPTALQADQTQSSAAQHDTPSARAEEMGCRSSGREDRLACTSLSQKADICVLDTYDCRSFRHFQIQDALQEGS